jgi:hypothetical protein
VESVSPETPPAIEQDAKQRKWQAKQLEANRPLGAWELYRALNDALDEGYELFDLSNREVRFALILMGGLNAALALSAARFDLAAGLSPIEGTIEGVALAVYVLLALGFLLQAIDALRPGQFRPHLAKWPDRDELPRGVRYFEDVVSRDTEAHWEAWRTVTLGQLNAELAAHFHSLCLKNQARKVALRRLYWNLRLLTIIFALMLILLLVFRTI